MISVHPCLIRDGENPTDVGIRLLHQVARRLLDEGPDASRARVGDDPAHRAVHLVAQLHAPLRGPRRLGQRCSAVLQPQQEHRIVLPGGLVHVHHRGAPREHVLDPVFLAEEVARCLDGVTTHVEQGAAARGLRVPEMRRVGTGVRLSRAHGQDVADRPALDHLARAHHVRREHLGLGVGVHHAGFAGHFDHLSRFASIARQGLGANHRFASGCCRAGGGEVEVVRQRDHHELDLGVGAHLLDRLVLTRHAVFTTEVRRAFLRT